MDGKIRLERANHRERFEERAGLRDGEFDGRCHLYMGSVDKQRHGIANGERGEHADASTYYAGASESVNLN